MKRPDLARQAIDKAINFDPTAKSDALADDRFKVFVER
jgi:hypothetical protein